MYLDKVSTELTFTSAQTRQDNAVYHQQCPSRFLVYLHNAFKKGTNKPLEDILYLHTYIVCPGYDLLLFG